MSKKFYFTSFATETTQPGAKVLPKTPPTNMLGSRDAVMECDCKIFCRNEAVRM
jgi:hypothetical protein